MEAIEQYFPVVLTIMQIMQYKVLPIFDFKNETWSVAIQNELLLAVVFSLYLSVKENERIFLYF